ncbi:MAG: hypothetical protein VX589_08850 [Myxococcota bacterium]|nr:hypothetical protein [Myxococcota bacterium]
MKIIKVFMIGACLLGMDVFLHELAPGNLWCPPLLLFFAVWLGTRQPSLACLLVLWMLTILEDGLSSTPVGTGLARLGTLYLLSGMVAQKLSVQRTFGAVVLGASTCVLDLICWAILARLGFPDMALNEKLSTLMLPRLVLGATCAPVVFWVLDRINGRSASVDRVSGLRLDASKSR